MGVRVKGGRSSPACRKPVAAVRTGHAVRNAVGAAATMGLSLKSERWLCPDCGGHAYNAKTGPKTTAAARKQETAAAVVTALLFVAIIAGVAAHTFIVFLAVVIVGRALLWGVIAKPFAASAGAGEGRRTGQWRCEKNDHLLNDSYERCPIDQSPVRRI